MKPRPFVIPVMALAFAFSLSGCLKTRAQLRDDEAPVHNKTEPLAPVGGYALDEVKSEITRLSGRIEDLERASKTENRAKTEEQVKALETRIKELEQAQLA